ncbi:MAG: two-component system histidine kinase PnpS [Bacillus sp. (in: firmicutes)]
MIKFRSKLLLTIVSLITLATVVLGVFIVQLLENHNYTNFEQDMMQQAKQVTSVIEEYGGLNTFLQETKKVDNLHLLVPDVIIVNNEMKVVYLSEVSNDPSQEQYVAQIKENILQAESGQAKLKQSLNLYYFWQPIKSENGFVEGYVILMEEFQDIRQLSDKAWYVLATIFVFFILFISYLILKIAKRFTKPIEAATDTAIELAKGNYRARTYENPTDEMSTLSKSINLLARNLQEMEVSREMQQDRLSTLIENIGSGVLLIDSKGYITLMNKSYKNLFHVSSSSFLYRLYYEVLPFSEVISLIEDIFVTEKSVKKQLLLSLEIERRYFEIYGAPIIGHNDEWKGIVVVFHDITDLKKLEQMRQDFVANVSHELRTPITSIKGFSETLLDGNLKDEKLTRDFLTIILNESDRLQALIKELLELSKIENQEFRLSLSLIDLNVLLEETETIFTQKAEEKGIRLSFVKADHPVEVEGDFARLKQVFINLITNAINYTPVSGSVTISMNEDEKYVYVEVKDTGIGIETEEIPRIFERFYRVDRARSRDSGGTGLGLAIVKHLVEAHKGQMKVESQIGKGTSFVVQLKKPKN